jgi:hypothetical protein
MERDLETIQLLICHSYRGEKSGHFSIAKIDKTDDQEVRKVETREIH